MKKQAFHLREPESDPYQIQGETNVTPDDPSEHLILWSIDLFDHRLIMPELSLLIQEFYCFN